jgi:hypothetical protein
MRPPLVLDEVIDGIGILFRAHVDHAMDVVNIKLIKVGGFTWRASSAISVLRWESR